ncbi:saccharopine dehydrogenase C-terminal domain-containing protein [Pontibacter sp. SGAir0037]|uniref:saccharopine dehydrogenase C-terminal domain-containing protein n=1 Tax=Pontibacter sp. SGAir0037 TaxID=2571030 RepID=UPI0010CCE0C7|nr:saccharopine dehydrogenase C-terminal domain-containing protein [Pontibacter sp. SGAir0037]QCR20932.1 saccharopine dehydrogenase [Pontibacter sp. SGAir0037]
MKTILLLGAGRSASVLINYLLQHAVQEQWQVRIGDTVVGHLQELVKHLPFAQAFVFDVQHAAQLSEETGKADLVISLLPAAFHIVVARECVKQGRHLITASYVTPELKALEQEAQQKQVIILMECGLDPGIDHMSAMAVVHRLQALGAKLLSFKSYTGGLLAPESDKNPWHYKFTWNPRNVVLAGQGTAKYIRNGAYKYIPYHHLFTRTDQLFIEDYGEFEGYANRDSLSYRDVYGLHMIPTMLRGTLRRKGFCEAWHVFVQLGLTDDSYLLEGSGSMTYRSYVEAFLPPASGAAQTIQQRLAQYLEIEEASDIMHKLAWLNLFEEIPVALASATPAQVLEKVLKEKWTLAPTDKDMIVMQHLFEYEWKGEHRELTATLVVPGDDTVQTAMAKTVGLPVGILAKLLLQGRVKQHGVVIPVSPELYEPVLAELKSYGINFKERDRLKEV